MREIKESRITETIDIVKNLSDTEVTLIYMAAQTLLARQQMEKEAG